MRYLLDTNVVVEILNDPSGAVARRLRRQQPSAVALSAIALHELYYGAFRSQRRVDNLLRVDSLQFQILDFDTEDARCAGEIRASLVARGTPIGAYDVLIAGQALARNLVLVTGNHGEFSRIDGLKVDSWLPAPSR